MSTYTAAKSPRQWRHPASRCESHIEDKRQGEARREISWIPVETPESPSPKRDFAALGLKGHEYIFENNRLQGCEDKEQFADYLVREARVRSWYLSQTKRRGEPVQMKRRVEAPIKIVTTTFSPWLSEWTYQKLSLGEQVLEKLVLIRNRWLEKAGELLTGLAHILGYSFHADTSNPHFDLCLTRQDGKGGRIGRPGLRLMGPWVVGIDRQIRADVEIVTEKQAQLERSVANFRHRYGGKALPLDVQLARTLDIAADEVIGPELVTYRIEYVRGLPLLEEQRTAAKLAMLDRARQKLAASLPQARPQVRPKTRRDIIPEP